MRSNKPATPSCGTFVAANVPGLVASRNQVLGRDIHHPPLHCASIDQATAGDMPALAERLLSSLAYSPVVFAKMAAPLEEATLLAIGRAMGNVLQETDGETQPFVRQGAILALDTVFGDDVESALQPFSTAPIALHTEGSRAPRSVRPSILIFHCVQPASADAGGQTVVSLVDDIVEHLTYEVREVLTKTRFASHPVGESVLAWQAGSWNLAYRDLQLEPMVWANDAGMPGRLVDNALCDLLRAMYAAPIHSLPFRSGSLVVISNPKVVHGRTSFAHGTNHRRLQRICVQRSGPFDTQPKQRE